MGSVKRVFSARVRISRSRSSEVIDFGTSRKRVLCDFLVVCHSNLGPILHRLRDIAVFAPPALFHPNFGYVSVGPDRRRWGQTAQLSSANQP